MPTIDTTLYVDRYLDEARPNPDGQTVTRYRSVQFRLGKFGPFVERFPSDGYTEQQLLDRVAALRRELESIHR